MLARQDWNDLRANMSVCVISTAKIHKIILDLPVDDCHSQCSMRTTKTLQALAHSQIGCSKINFLGIVQQHHTIPRPHPPSGQLPGNQGNRQLPNMSLCENLA